jgi:hypothetical protein
VVNVQQNAVLGGIPEDRLARYRRYVLEFSENEARKAAAKQQAVGAPRLSRGYGRVSGPKVARRQSIPPPARIRTPGPGSGTGVGARQRARPQLFAIPLCDGFRPFKRCSKRNGLEPQL